MLTTLDLNAFIKAARRLLDAMESPRSRKASKAWDDFSRDVRHWEQSNPEECNGWSNQETWTANLWLANEQVTSERARAICDPVHGRSKYENGRLLEEYVQRLSGSLHGESTMRADMFGCAMSRVVWSEVASHFEER